MFHSHKNLCLTRKEIAQQLRKEGEAKKKEYFIQREEIRQVIKRQEIKEEQEYRLWFDTIFENPFNY